MTRVKLLRGLPGAVAGAMLAAGLVVLGAGPAAAANGITVSDITLEPNGMPNGGIADQIVSVSGTILGTNGTLVVTIAQASGLHDSALLGYTIDPATNSTCTEPVAQMTLYEIDCTSPNWGAGQLSLAFDIGGGGEGPVIVTNCSQNPVATTTAEYAGDGSTLATGTAVDAACASTPTTTAATTDTPTAATTPSQAVVVAAGAMASTAASASATSASSDTATASSGRPALRPRGRQKAASQHLPLQRYDRRPELTRCCSGR